MVVLRFERTSWPCFVKFFVLLLEVVQLLLILNHHLAFFQFELRKVDLSITSTSNLLFLLFASITGCENAFILFHFYLVFLGVIDVLRGGANANGKFNKLTI